MTNKESTIESNKFPGNWEWIGFAFEGNQLAAACVVGGGGKRPLVQQVWRATIENENGLIEFSEAHVCALREMIGARFSRKTKISLVLEDSDYEVLTMEELDIKDVDEVQKMQALRWAVQSLVGFPMDRASIDVLMPPSDGRRQITAVVSSEETIGRWMRAAFNERLNLSAIDVRETAQRNIAHLNESEDRAIALLVIYSGRALLTLSYRGDLLMTRRIELGDVALLATDARMRDRLGLEVQRTLDNFERQSGRAGATDLLVAPGMLANAVAEHLKTALGLPVEALTTDRILQSLDVASDVTVGIADWSHLEFLAIGAACRGASK